MDNIKDRLNIIGKGFVKENSMGGEVISFVPDIPISGFLDDFLFIFTIPNDYQKFSPVFCRLQNKMRDAEKPIEEMSSGEFTEVRSVGFLKNRDRNDIIICAPRQHVFVDFNKLVVIATIPEEKATAPVYFRKKLYQKSKSELENPALAQKTEEIVEVEVAEEQGEVGDNVNEKQRDQIDDFLQGVM